MNQTVQQGSNVTFTCETQIDALPVFLFYKIDSTAFEAFDRSEPMKNAQLLQRHSHPLQDRVILLKDFGFEKDNFK